SQRNDQRNAGFWKIDARIEKSFSIGKVEASGFFSIENLLNDDWLTIGALDLAALNGVSLRNYQGVPLRDIGRRFELGASFNF
ncbi:MAG TPA: hypothetical protein VFP98_09015, partial [Candidatus Polarisedimenticolia bacterium]|nr:hypothetical protein [Candidatus Polarisedimenticolia bacterium]